MTHSIVLLLKGPMQSWGDSSRYKQRATGPIPTKSGVLGLIAAGQGRRRTDPIEDLARLRFAVRVDQPGNLLRDFQTARPPGGKPAELVNRYYLADAAFVAAVECPSRELVDSLADALRSPRFPLFLGRRSCPVPANLVLNIVDTDAVGALRREPWHASRHHRQGRAKMVELPIYRDALPGEHEDFRRQDVPLSYAQEHRRYGWRGIVQETRGVQLDNPDGSTEDPYFEAVLAQ